MAVEAGNVNAGNLCNLGQKLLLGPVLGLGAVIQGNNFYGTVLALTEGEKVKEISQRLGIEGTHTACKDDIFQPLAVLGMQGDTCQIHHVQNVGVGHLVADGESHHVKILHRGLAFQRPQGQIMLAHGLFHIAPRCKDTLAPNAIHLVHHTVQDTHTHIGHADLIGVWEAECHADTHICQIFFDLVKFTAGVPRRLLHSRQDSLYQFCHSFPSLLKVSFIVLKTCAVCKVFFFQRQSAAENSLPAAHKIRSVYEM